MISLLQLTCETESQLNLSNSKFLLTASELSCHEYGDPCISTISENHPDTSPLILTADLADSWSQMDLAILGLGLDLAAK